jgi:hypothetical protein
MTDYKPEKPQLKYWWLEDSTPEPKLTKTDVFIVMALAAIFTGVVFYAGWQSFGWLMSLT